MKVEIDPRKTIHENAAGHYEKAKKLRAKMDGLKRAIEETKRLVAAEEKKQAVFEELASRKKFVRSKEWYEKFHWFFSSSGRLAVGGKDAKSNEAIVKRHMEAGDVYFHADVHGASSVVLKDGQRAGEQERAEAAQFAACFSNAWKAGRPCDVFCVAPEQVKTAAKSGEYLASGSFVIEGKREWFRNQELELGLVFKEGKLCAVPASLAAKGVLIVPNPRETKGESAKKILRSLLFAFPGAPLDAGWVQEVLPNGGSKATGARKV